MRLIIGTAIGTFIGHALMNYLETRRAERAALEEIHSYGNALRWSLGGGEA